ncbi:FG-GAP repeat domain-containing protein [Gemmatirosa kalamazoonensis]|nr:VCBS repeat-containing protein [Gemmatirosa kalamazoonensis]
MRSAPAARAHDGLRPRQRAPARLVCLTTLGTAVAACGDARVPTAPARGPAESVHAQAAMSAASPADHPGVQYECQLPAAGTDLQLLFQQPQTGELAYWSLHGAALRSAGALPGVPASWAGLTAVGGSVFWTVPPSVAVMERRFAGFTTLVDRGQFHPTAPDPWRVVAIGSVNNPGYSVIWRHPVSGEVVVWEVADVNVAPFVLRSVSNGAVPLAWRVETAGDLDGDGESDLFWVNDANGARVVWLLRHGAYASTVDLGVVPTAWRIGGVADLDGDGQRDIVWQSTTTGHLVTWIMSNGAYVRTVPTATRLGEQARVPTPWRLFGVQRAAPVPAPAPKRLGIHLGAQQSAAVGSTLPLYATGDMVCSAFGPGQGTPPWNGDPSTFPPGYIPPPYIPPCYLNPAEVLPPRYTVTWTSSASGLAAVAPDAAHPLWGIVTALGVTGVPVTVTATLRDPCGGIIAITSVAVTVTP